MVQIRVPGKIMLAGEYAVLRGGACIACTIEPYLTVLCTLQEGYSLASDLWKTPRVFPLSELASISASEPFIQAVQEAAQHWHLPGARIEVHSQLTIEAGLGSSSALRGAVIAALAQVRAPDTAPLSRESLIETVTQLQRVSQRHASGYDIMTQVHGGLLLLVPDTGAVQPLASDSLEPICEAWAGGKGAPTGPTMQDTLAWLDAGDRWPALMLRSQAAVNHLVGFFSHHLSLDDLLAEMGRYRQFFEAAPHFPSAIHTVFEGLSGLDRTWSYKPTGAGGEDSLLLLGSAEARAPARERLQKLGWYRLPGKLGVAGIERKEGTSWQPLFT